MTGDLEVTDLSLVARGGRRLLQIDSLVVPAGSSLAISGPSGAGKSTLLFAVAGLLGGCSGSIRWGSTELLTLNAAARDAFRRRHLGLMFQDFLLFEELDALANATLAAGFAPRAERAALARHASGILERLGMDPSRRQRVDSLSGGERQRVALARALAGSPTILLTDEPTASLDWRMADRLIDDLLAACRHCGSTLLLVTHDPALQSRLDRHLRLEEGRLRG